jgi:hypothetical protein
MSAMMDKNGVQITYSRVNSDDHIANRQKKNVS